MKCTSFPVVAALLVLETSAHYMFSHLIVNQSTTPDFKYVRDVGEDPVFAGTADSLGKIAPQFNIDSIDITCGRSAFASATKTQTADVVAGSELGFRLYDSMNPARAYPATIFHPGPAQIYLSKAPNGELENFSGIGEEAEWFKIASFTSASETEWATYQKDSVNFTIPETTPAGKYLLRIEQFMPTSSFNYTQWYVNCAHINIIGRGGGSLQGYDFAKFPGSYDIMDPGLWIGWAQESQTSLSDYIAPGPAVWKG
ncbi:hypothetical protein CC78DRAFT_582130 [Lojkania enalia]|uniref:lytic cellulose monooxygenase (C4-dehydrogenating) n=1 Tax=Lojkania enalia TaxID=147567 RepID=A0A9P4N570_9PLEO|nr:hypothetical protein CC78DRAFT_582130 [Didymosphaeria enalia]